MTESATFLLILSLLFPLFPVNHICGNDELKESLDKNIALIAGKHLKTSLWSADFWKKRIIDHSNSQYDKRTFNTKVTSSKSLTAKKLSNTNPNGYSKVWYDRKFSSMKVATKYTTLKKTGLQTRVVRKLQNTATKRPISTKKRINSKRSPHFTSDPYRRQKYPRAIDPLMEEVDELLQSNNDCFQLVPYKIAATIRNRVKNMLYFKLKDMKNAFVYNQKDMNYTLKDMNKTLVNALNALVQVKKERNIYRSLIDLSEMVYFFFMDCWPPWAGERPNYSYTRADWDKIFLNYEHSRIKQLKFELVKHNMTERDFADSVSRLVTIRGKEEHGMIPAEFKEEIYKDLLNILDDDKHILIVNALIFPKVLNKPSSFTSAEKSALESAEAKRASTYRLLRIPSYKQTIDYDYVLERVFEEFTQKVNAKNPSGHYKGALATFKGNKGGGYVLFETFQDAYIAWTARDSIALIPQHKYSMIIEPVPCAELNLDLVSIKITVEPSNLENVHTQLLQLNLPGDFYFTNERDTLFYFVDNGVNGMIFFKKIKNMVEEKQLVETIEAISSKPKGLTQFPRKTF